MIKERELNLLLNKIKRERKLDLTNYKQDFIRRRISFLINKEKSSLKTYIHNLDDKKYHELLKALSINVSEFFRDPSTFSLFEHSILPSIITEKQRKGHRVLRMWSAGCSSGEEPYSIAINILELLKHAISDFMVSVTGTDIDADALEMAKNGVYKQERLKNVSENLLATYFIKKGEFYIVNDQVKRYVRFQQHNLIHDNPHNYFDVIFCRNVLIYFSRPLQEKLFEHFYQSLQEGGFLVLGKTESISGIQRDKFDLIDISERVYRKG